MTISDLKNFLQAKNFSLKNGSKDLWTKKYKNAFGYSIEIEIKDSVSKSTINWGEQLMKNISEEGRKTTCNFKDDETIVVLDCVDRLIERGYKPQHIFLEKNWRLGHKGKGFLDVLVKDLRGNSYLMIECKTWGKEYDKEKMAILKDGGQIFSYYIQEKSTNFLCLYAASFQDGVVEYKRDIIVINKEMRSAQNQRDAFEMWTPQVFEIKGIFEETEVAYSVKFSGIKKKDLKPLTKEDGGDIFNRFAEILRKNVVSDKSNAFNKIFNLFLCKIVDEDRRSQNEEVRFQWKNDESNEDVMLRLNDLYKEGMDLYLQLQISAVSEEEINQTLGNIGTSENKKKLRELFIKQKLYSSNEFAFKELFDKESFDENCIVVKEVVKLLERYQIKYAHRQQFLGDFFEKLLNAGIKQEAGQFFTPIPLAAFISKSLPIKETIDSKNKRGEINILPYAIDYASGSGHFLTEVMAEIDRYVKDINNDPSYIKGGTRARTLFDSQKDNYLWAKEYVYGIEKDYRLAKTTKISTFLNGDGDANIICGDGLDNFSISKDYKGKLKITNDGINNEQFDILVSNPPYSVSGFKTTIKNGKNSFDLFDSVTDQSSEIEALFVERAKQLLHPGAVAGLILPISVLSNGKIYTRIREIILKNFEIVALVQLGSNAFMATGTKTVIFFLRKKAENQYAEAENIILRFFETTKDFSWKNENNIIQEYVKVAFQENIELTDYLSLFKKRVSEKLRGSDFWNEGSKNLTSDEEIIELLKQKEKEKLIYFLLTYGQKVVLVRSGEKQREKNFLGYSFSNRRGSEGIKIRNSSTLYNPIDLYDETKANSYILKNFENKQIQQVNPIIANNLQLRNLHEMINFDRTDFEKTISINFGKRLTFKSKFKIEKLAKFQERGDLAFIQGVVFGKTDQVFHKTNKRILTASNIDLATRSIDLSEELYLRNDSAVDEDKKFRENDIFICTSSGSINHLGKSALITKDTGSYFGGFCAVIRCKNSQLAKYLFAMLDSEEYRDFIERIVGQNINNLNSKILEFAIPNPDENALEEIVKNLDRSSKETQKVRREIEKVKKQKSDLVIKDIENVDNKDRLGNLSIDIIGGGTPSTDTADYWQGNIPWVTLVDSKQKYITDTQRKITEKGLHNSSAQLVPVNTVIFSSRATIGDVSIAKVPLATNQGYKNIVCNPDKVEYEYLYYVLKNEANNIREMVSMTIYPEISKSVLSDYRVPNPDLTAQRSFVKKMLSLEDQLADLTEEIESKRAQQRSTLKVSI